MYNTSKTRSNTIKELRKLISEYEWKLSSYEEICSGDLYITLPNLPAGDYSFKLDLDDLDEPQIFIDLGNKSLDLQEQIDNMRCENIRLKDHIKELEKKNKKIKTNKTNNFNNLNCKIIMQLTKKINKVKNKNKKLIKEISELKLYLTYSRK